MSFAYLTEQYPEAYSCHHCDGPIHADYSYPGRWRHIETGSAYCSVYLDNSDATSAAFRDQRKARPVHTIRELP